MEAEAAIIRTIFKRFLEGLSTSMIFKMLNDADIPRPSEKHRLKKDTASQVEETPHKEWNPLCSEKMNRPIRMPKWSVSTVESILINEKYKGDAILQKIY